MSSGITTDKAGIEAQMSSIGISQEHFTNVEAINSYFDQHKINQLFNVRPPSPLLFCKVNQPNPSRPIGADDELA